MGEINNTSNHIPGPSALPAIAIPLLPRYVHPSRPARRGNVLHRNHWDSASDRSLFVVLMKVSSASLWVLERSDCCCQTRSSGVKVSGGCTQLAIKVQCPHAYNTPYITPFCQENTKPYNVSTVTCNELIVGNYISSDRNDAHTLIPFMKQLNTAYAGYRRESRREFRL